MALVFYCTKLSSLCNKFSSLAGEISELITRELSDLPYPNTNSQVKGSVIDYRTYY